MDVSKLKAASTATLHIKGADGMPLYDEGKPVRIKIHGPGTTTFGIVDARQTARSLARLNNNEGKITAPSAEERLAETAEDLADITISFEGLTSGDLVGRELFLAVYGDPELGYITKQVNKALGDWGNFKPASPVN
jgi:hypothetical protein